jgi:hypothetical protein
LNKRKPFSDFELKPISLCVLLFCGLAATTPPAAISHHPSHKSGIDSRLAGRPFVQKKGVSPLNFYFIVGVITVLFRIFKAISAYFSKIWLKLAP